MLIKQLAVNGDRSPALAKVSELLDLSQSRIRDYLQMADFTDTASRRTPSAPTSGSLRFWKHRSLLHRPATVGRATVLRRSEERRY